MRVVIVNTFDIKGGAAKGAFRLYKALKDESVDCKLLVLYKNTNYKDIYTIEMTELQNLISSICFTEFNKLFDKIMFKLICDKKNKELFSTGIGGFKISSNKLIKDADIVHLNWINNNYIDIKELKKIKKPIVWTLQDMWAFTGGCHYSKKCVKYKTNCSKCSMIKRNYHFDLSKYIFNRKKIYFDKNMEVVAISDWLKQCIKKSKLLKNNNVTKILNAIDTDVFKPIYKDHAREKLHIENNKFIITFGADNVFDKRKGYKYLIQAISILIKKHLIPNLYILIFGSDFSETKIHSGITYHYIAKMENENKLVQIYSASDVFVAPSLQEALGYTAMESLACETPVVAFEGVGISDLVEHKNNGYLAKYRDSKSLAEGIYWICKNNRNNWIGKNGRKKVIASCSNNVIATQYIEIYNKLLRY